jgi:uncharacterized protein (UPF0333 family)
MVAIVVILASLVTIFVFSVGESLTQTAPRASFDTESSAAGVTLVHSTGESIPASELTLVVGGKRIDASALVREETIQAGSRIGPVNPGGATEVKLVWERDDRSSVIYSATQYGEGIFLPDPAGYWKLEDVEDGTAEDASSNSFDGTVSGDLTSVPGKLGQAAAFDGSSGQIITLGDRNAFKRTSFTISAWINRTGGGSKNIVSKWRGDYTFEVSPDEELRAAIDDSGNPVPILDSRDTLPTGTWKHVVFTYNASADRIRTYIDGEETDPSPLPTDDIQTDSAELAIGAQTDPNKAGKVFDGRIDDVRFYGQVLSKQEIAALYDATK